MASPFANLAPQVFSKPALPQANQHRGIVVALVSYISVTIMGKTAAIINVRRSVVLQVHQRSRIASVAQLPSSTFAEASYSKYDESVQPSSVAQLPSSTFAEASYSKYDESVQPRTASVAQGPSSKIAERRTAQYDESVQPRGEASTRSALPSSDRSREASYRVYDESVQPTAFASVAQLPSSKIAEASYCDNESVATQNASVAQLPSSTFAEASTTPSTMNRIGNPELLA